MNLFRKTFSKIYPSLTCDNLISIPNYPDDILHKIIVGKYKIIFDRVIIHSAPNRTHVLPMTEIVKHIKYANWDFEGELFQNFVFSHNYSYAIALKKFQKKGFKKGSELKSKIFFKRYFPTEEEWLLNRKNITHHNCTFIDYEKKLANNTNIIQDIDYGDGLYASNSWLNGNSSVGTKFMVLRTISFEKYLVSGNEIVGDKFEVIEYGLDYDTVNKKYTLSVL